MQPTASDWLARESWKRNLARVYVELKRGYLNYFSSTNYLGLNVKTLERSTWHDLDYDDVILLGKQGV